MVESTWAGSRSGRLQRRCSGPTPEEERREVVIEEEEKHKNNSPSVARQFPMTACLLHARCHHRHLNFGLSSIYSILFLETPPLRPARPVGGIPSTALPCHTVNVQEPLFLSDETRRSRMYMCKSTVRCYTRSSPDSSFWKLTSARPPSPTSCRSLNSHSRP